MCDVDIPDFGAVFTFGKSRFAENIPSHFFIRNDPIVEISCGEQHTAVVCTNGRLFVFGSNEWGQLGLGHRDHVNKPSCVKMLKPEKVNHVACGKAHTIISVASGKVYACGYNKDGQLGTGDNEVLDYVTVPTKITEVTEGTVTQVSAGSEHSALLTSVGFVYVWGNNSQGQLGFSKLNTNIYPRPKLLDMNATVNFLCCGYYHTGFIVEERLLVCGNNESGQLGIDVEKRKTIWTPQETPIPKKPTFISFGYLHSVAIVESGKVYVCGSNSNGQLGVENINNIANEWTLVKSLEDYVITQVSCGSNHTMFVTDESELFCCGDTRYGKLIISDLSSPSISITIPQKIEEPFANCNIMKVECGGCHSMIMANIKAQNEDTTERVHDEDEHLQPENSNEQTANIVTDFKSLENTKDVNFIRDSTNVKTPLLVQLNSEELKLSSVSFDNYESLTGVMSEESAPAEQEQQNETNPFSEDNDDDEQLEEQKTTTTTDNEQETGTEQNAINTTDDKQPSIVEEILVIETMIIKDISDKDTITFEEKTDDNEHDSTSIPQPDTKNENKTQTTGKNRVKSKLCTVL